MQEYHICPVIVTILFNVLVFVCARVILCLQNRHIFDDTYNYKCMGHLGAEAKGHQHEEEENGPEWRDGHLGEALGVHDEHEARTCHRHRLYTNIL